MLVYKIFLKVLQECPIFTNFVVEMAEKAQFPGCLMNV